VTVRILATKSDCGWEDIDIDDWLREREREREIMFGWEKVILTESFSFFILFGICFIFFPCQHKSVFLCFFFMSTVVDWVYTHKECQRKIFLFIHWGVVLIVCEQKNDLKNYFATFIITHDLLFVIHRDLLHFC